MRIRRHIQSLDIASWHRLQPHALPDAAHRGVPHASPDFPLFSIGIPGRQIVQRFHHKAVLPGLQIPRHIAAKRQIAALMCPRQMPVQEHLHHLIHSPEMQQNMSSSLLFEKKALRQRETSGIFQFRAHAPLISRKLCLGRERHLNPLSVQQPLSVEAKPFFPAHLRAGVDVPATC